MFVVMRMVLKKASTSPAAPVFRGSDIGKALHNATSFSSQPVPQ